MVFSCSFFVFACELPGAVVIDDDDDGDDDDVEDDDDDEDEDDDDDDDDDVENDGEIIVESGSSSIRAFFGLFVLFVLFEFFELLLLILLLLEVFVWLEALVFESACCTLRGAVPVDGNFNSIKGSSSSIMACRCASILLPFDSSHPFIHSVIHCHRYKLPKQKERKRCNCILVGIIISFGFFFAPLAAPPRPPANPLDDC